MKVLVVIIYQDNQNPLKNLISQVIILIPEMLKQAGKVQIQNAGMLRLIRSLNQIIIRCITNLLIIIQTEVTVNLQGQLKVIHLQQDQETAIVILLPQGQAVKNHTHHLQDLAIARVIRHLQGQVVQSHILHPPVQEVALVQAEARVQDQAGLRAEEGGSYKFYFGRGYYYQSRNFQFTFNN